MKPTNKKLVFNRVDVDKVSDGKIVEHGGAVNTFETLFREGLIMPKACTDKSGEKYPKVHVDASFPAESMYLKRGYQIVSYEKMEKSHIILWSCMVDREWQARHSDSPD